MRDAARALDATGMDRRLLVKVIGDALLDAKEKRK